MMSAVFGRFSAQAFAIMRVVTGLLFVCHGGQKLLGWPHSEFGTVKIASLMGAAGIIELVGGLLIAIGLFTSIAALIAAGEMAVAYFMQHAPHGPIPLINKGSSRLSTVSSGCSSPRMARGSGASTTHGDDARLGKKSTGATS